MPLYPKSEYTFQRFERSSRPTKKYAAILKSKSTNRLVTIHFGATGYPQTHRVTIQRPRTRPIHNDKTRRTNYRARHASDINKPYSPSYFSLKYLW